MLIKTIFSIFGTLFKIGWMLLKYPLALLGIIAIIYIVLYLKEIKKLKKQGVKKPIGIHNKVKRSNIFKQIFKEMPKQFAIDYMNKNPEYFRHHGIIMFVGRQGKGKTIALVEQMMNYQLEYPKCKVMTNLDYKYQNKELKHWEEMIGYSNGIQGTIIAMDEMQNWFSSNDSKNFDENMLTEITQNRKNRRVMLGTSQVFTRVAKPIREQTTEVRECLTLLGCFTIVIRKEPILDSEGYVEKYKYKGMYSFVHNETIRNAYDTYKKIERLKMVGAKPLSERLPIDSEKPIIEIKQEKRKIFKK